MLKSNDRLDAKDVKINVLDNNEILSCIKKWKVYPFEFIEAYHAAKNKTLREIEEYLRDKGLINIA